MVANGSFFGVALLYISIAIGVGAGLAAGLIAWLLAGVWAGVGFGLLALVLSPIIAWAVWLR